jgi:hypothetical protein
MAAGYNPTIRELLEGIKLGFFFRNRAPPLGHDDYQFLTKCGILRDMGTQTQWIVGIQQWKPFWLISNKQ